MAKETNHWFVANVRNNILAGILLVIPAALAFLVLVWLFVNIDNILQPIITKFTGYDIVGLGFVISLIIIYLVGLMARNIVGHRLVRFGESLVARIPLARQIYQSSKHVVAGLSGTGMGKAAFRDVVLLEFPWPGMKTIGFVTNEIKDKNGNPLLAVYVPTAIVPTGGFFEIIPKDEVCFSDMSVEQALQLVISCGIVCPEEIEIGDYCPSV